MRIAATFTAAADVSRRGGGAAVATLRAGLRSVAQIGGSDETVLATSVGGASVGGGAVEGASIEGAGSGAADAFCGGGGPAAGAVGCGGGTGADTEGADATTEASGSGASGIEMMVSGAGAAGVEEGIADKEANRLAAAFRIGCQIGGEALMSSSFTGGRIVAIAAKPGAGVDVALASGVVFEASAGAD